jgi:hypothetical protein
VDLAGSRLADATSARSESEPFVLSDLAASGFAAADVVTSKADPCIVPGAIISGAVIPGVVWRVIPGVVVWVVIPGVVADAVIPGAVIPGVVIPGAVAGIAVADAVSSKVVATAFPRPCDAGRASAPAVVVGPGLVPPSSAAVFALGAPADGRVEVPGSVNPIRRDSPRVRPPAQLPGPDLPKGAAFEPWAASDPAPRAVRAAEFAAESDSPAMDKADAPGDAIAEGGATGLAPDGEADDGATTGAEATGASGAIKTMVGAAEVPATGGAASGPAETPDTAPPSEAGDIEPTDDFGEAIEDSVDPTADCGDLADEAIAAPDGVSEPAGLSADPVLCAGTSALADEAGFAEDGVGTGLHLVGPLAELRGAA